MHPTSTRDITPAPLPQTRTPHRQTTCQLLRRSTTIASACLDFAGSLSQDSEAGRLFEGGGGGEPARSLIDTLLLHDGSRYDLTDMEECAFAELIHLFPLNFDIF